MDASHCQCDALCAALLAACCQICAGCCLDYTSLRHDFTEDLCTCRSSSKSRSRTDSVDEREPLLSSNRQPSPHPPMRPSGD
ncbi:hypothetical protein IW261DRAFT_1487576 [Armillaria novae-zelandiae]|uniref:Secreted protein n=1 Tax=Armillaria novae-zelandiae TaxID=153914 RepID=A0AA39P4P5_9AGAR|nr:hypothetical protein IW261DRAFT_1487576 [Armillaria novae-zelandiae]